MNNTKTHKELWEAKKRCTACYDSNLRVEEEKNLLGEKTGKKLHICNHCGTVNY